MKRSALRVDDRAQLNPFGDEIVVAARRYVDVPFRHQGRDARTGLDCVGLAVVISHDVDLPCLDSLHYSDTPSPRGFLTVLARTCDRISGDDPLALEADPNALVLAQPGDLLVFSPTRPGFPRHAAVFTGRTIVHARKGAGINRVVEESIDEWRAVVHSAWRIRWQRSS